MTDNVFSLLDEHWIPVSYLDGHPAEISLREIFLDAPKIKELSGDIPQQKLPLMRFLLAIMYRAYCIDGADEEQMRELWEGIYSSGQFNEDALDYYFDEWADRFFLLGERPFFQVPGLQYVGSKPYSPVSEMIADVPKPDKYLFSMRDLRAADSLLPAEAARWLVFLQAYDTAGIKTPVEGNTHVNKGKVYAPKGMLGTGWLGGIGGLYAEGRNLFETLMLNWVLYDTKFDSERYRLFGNNQDIPVWEREDPPSTDLNDQNRFVGPVQAMTWQSRRVRLVPSEDNARIIGIMSCYGDVVAPYNTDVFEKMTAWRSSVTQQKKLGLPAPPHMPVVHDGGKALWRGLEPILCASDEGDSRPGLIRWLEEIRTEILESEKHVLDLVTIHAQGMTYGTQSSVFETGIDDTLSLNSVMFRHDYSGIASVLDVVKCTDGAVLALSQFVRNLRAASGDKGKSTETAEQVREWAYADLDGLFRDELAAFDETQDPIEYANAWKDEIHRRLLQMGWEYLDQSSVPVFGEHESGVVGVMGASRAQLLFQSKLNKELGFLEEKDASRPNKGGM